MQLWGIDMHKHDHGHDHDHGNSARRHRLFRHRNVPRAFEGRSSRMYNLFARTLFRGAYRRLARDIAVTAPRDATVLDIGTGPGVLLQELAKLRPDLTLNGIDLSADMVAAATANLGPRATVRVGDVAALPFDDDSFDLIVSSFSSHHWDHPEAAGPELTRVLRPGGRAHIYDFTWAPFEAIGAQQDRARVRTGIPFFPRCVSATLSA